MAQSQAGRSKWVTLAILTAVYTLHGMDRNVMSVLLEPLGKDLKLSDAQLGLLSGLGYSATFALAAIPAGLLADRVNRRNLLAAALTVWSLLTGACGLAQNYVSLLLSRMTVGAAESAASPASMSIISDLFAPERRAFAVSLFYLSSSIAFAATFILGSYVADHSGWRAVFIIAAIPGPLLALLLLFAVREPLRGASEATVQAVTGKAFTFARSLKFILGTPYVMHLFAAIIVCAAVQAAYTIWVLSFLIRVHGLGLAQAGFIVGLGSALLGAVGSLIAGAAADRLQAGGGRRAAIVPAIGCALAAACSAAMLIAPSPVIAIAFALLFKPCIYSYMGPGFGMVVSSCPPEGRGIVTSNLNLSSTLIGYGLGPSLIGIISTAVGGPNSLRVALICIPVLCAWASLHFFLATRASDGRTVAAAPAHQ